MADQQATGVVLPRIAVIGAGVCGLILAQGLQKVPPRSPHLRSQSNRLTSPLQNGFPVTVYEKENFIGERAWEWTMIIH